MKIYSGSGVIPIVIIKNIPYLVLFMSNHGTITDAGGRLEKESTILDTASRELLEESAGLFNINITILDKKSFYIDKEHHGKYYRSYFIIIDNFDSKYYFKNLEKINKYNLNPFSETNNILFIKFDYLHIVNNNMFIKTENNKYIFISDRTKHIIKTILNKFNNLNDFVIKLKKKIDLIKLKKEIISINSYIYKYHTEFSIKNIDTYTSI